MCVEHVRGSNKGASNKITSELLNRENRYNKKAKLDTLAHLTASGGEVASTSPYITS